MFLPRRSIEDYAVVYVGSPVFKILRLIIIAIFSVHFFACIFYRVKEVSAVSREDVTDFYVSRNVDEEVSLEVACPDSSVQVGSLLCTVFSLI